MADKKEKKITLNKDGTPRKQRKKSEKDNPLAKIKRDIEKQMGEPPVKDNSKDKNNSFPVTGQNKLGNANIGKLNDMGFDFSTRCGSAIIGQKKYIGQFLQYKENGFSDAVACKYSSFTEKSLNKWKHRALEAVAECEEKDLEFHEHKDYDYIVFYGAYIEIHREVSTELMTNVVKMSKHNEFVDSTGEVHVFKGDPKLALKLLEIFDPEAFREQKDININQSVKGGVLLVGEALHEKAIEGQCSEKLEEEFLNDLGDQQAFIANEINEINKNDEEEK